MARAKRVSGVSNSVVYHLTEDRGVYCFSKIIMLTASCIRSLGLARVYQRCLEKPFILLICGYDSTSSSSSSSRLVGNGAKKEIHICTFLILALCKYLLVAR